MTRLLEGKPVAAEIRSEVAAAVEEMVSRGLRRPGLTAVLVGEDPASQVYVRNKARASRRAGLRGEVRILDAAIDAEQLAETVEALNDDDDVDAILIQLPLPKGLPEHELVSRIAPEKDVDGLHPSSVGNLWLDRPGLAPATPSGIIQLLRRSEIPLPGRHAVIVGRSQLVGKPLAALLLREQCTVTICHSRTRDLAAVCRQADLLVAAVGVPGLIGPDHVREGAVVIDVGINRVDDAETVARLFPENAERRARFEDKGSVLVGDVDFDRVEPIASAITPVPGGVGPLTIAMLLVNTLQASRARQGLEPDR